MVSDEERSSSNRAAVLTAGVLAAVAGFCAVATPRDSCFIGLVCSPLFLGALAGGCVPSKPILAAALSVPIATAVVAVGVGEARVWVVCALPFLVVWALPTAILGAICARTIWRWLRGAS